MVASSQITPGMIIKLDNKLFRVESSVKVTVAKGTPFIKTKLKDLVNDKTVEKNFKPTQQIEEAVLKEKPLEFLYLEGKDFMFLDTSNLEQVAIPSAIVSEAVHYLKEGISLNALIHDDIVYGVELPPFLELMISKIEGDDEQDIVANATKIAVLETGAKVEIPPFVEVGDIIKIDTTSGEYIQRV